MRHWRLRNRHEAYDLYDIDITMELRTTDSSRQTIMPGRKFCLVLPPNYIARDSWPLNGANTLIKSSSLSDSNVVSAGFYPRPACTRRLILLENYLFVH